MHAFIWFIKITDNINDEKLTKSFCLFFEYFFRRKYISISNGITSL